MERFKNINYIQWLAILLGLRALYDFSAPQAAISVALFGYMAFREWMKGRENTEITNQIKALEEKALEAEQTRQEVSELRTNMSGIMIKNASKPELMKREMDGRRFF